MWTEPEDHAAWGKQVRRVVPRDLILISIMDLILISIMDLILISIMDLILILVRIITL